MAAGQAGQSIGGIIGGVAGSVIPGVGTAIGSAAGQSIGGLIGSGIDRKKAQALRPSDVDPLEAERLAEVEQRAQAIRTGSDVATQRSLDEIGNIAASTREDIGRFTGGDVGSTVEGFLQSQRVAGQQAGTAIAQGQRNLPFFENLAQSLGSRISQRKLDLQQFERAQTQAEAAQARKDAVLTGNAILASQGSLPGEERDFLGDVVSGIGEGIGSGARRVGEFFGGLTFPDLIGGRTTTEDTGLELTPEQEFFVERNLAGIVPSPTAPQ